MKELPRGQYRLMKLKCVRGLQKGRSIRLNLRSNCLRNGALLTQTSKRVGSVLPFAATRLCYSYRDMLFVPRMLFVPGIGHERRGSFGGGCLIHLGG